MQQNQQKAVHQKIRRSNPYRNNRTQAATMVYANKVPIDIILTNCERLKRADINPKKIINICTINILVISIRLPVNTPARSVPITGEENRLLITPRNRKINPSDAMAYKILGNGNIAPNKLRTKYSFRFSSHFLTIFLPCKQTKDSPNSNNPLSPYPTYFCKCMGEGGVDILKLQQHNTIITLLEETEFVHQHKVSNYL